MSSRKEERGFERKRVWFVGEDQRQSLTVEKFEVEKGVVVKRLKKLPLMYLFKLEAWRLIYLFKLETWRLLNIFV